MRLWPFTRRKKGAKPPARRNSWRPLPEPVVYLPGPMQPAEAQEQSAEAGAAPVPELVGAAAPPAGATAAQPPVRLPAGRRASASSALPFWLRAGTRGRGRPVVHRPTPREPRWWVGVAWMIVSVLLLGFVAHATLFGALQHARSQAVGYEQLRALIAKAESPLGQLDVDEALVVPGTPVALLEIPSIGLREVVLYGTGPEQLRQGPGLRRDTAMPGQAGTSVLYGRQSAYGGPFGQLPALAPGDTIRVTTGQGRFEFEVFGLRRAGDPLPEPLAAGEGRLQLVTADGPALAPGGVLYVDASLEDEPAATPARVFTEAALAPGEREMEADPNALLPFLFTFQWLAASAIVARWLLKAWGRWQTWIVAGPVLLVLGATAADRAMSLLPNLI